MSHSVPNPDDTLRAPARSHPVTQWPFDLADELRTACICPRVSAQSQVDDGASMESQEIELRKLCGERDLRVTARAPWVGTATLRRDEFWDDIFAGIKRGDYHIVMFWEAGRMTRRGDWNGFARLDRIEEMGADWYIMSVGDDVKRVESWEYRSHILTPHFNAAKRFIITLRANVAMGHDRLIEGRQMDKETGRHKPPQPIAVNRPALGLAWPLDAAGRRLKTHMVVVEGLPGWATIEFAYDQAPLIRTGWGLARALNAAGHTTREGKPFEARTALDLIRNPIYKGEVHNRRYEFFYDPEKETRRKRERPVSERKIITGYVQRECGLPIISEARWQIANDALDSRSGVKIGLSGPRAIHEPHAHLLRGLGECGYCHNALTCTWRNRNGKNIPVYRCNGSTRASKPCPGFGQPPAEMIDREIWAAISARVADPSLIRQAVEQAQAQAAPRAAEAAAHRRAIAKLNDAWKHACDAYNVHPVGSRSYLHLKEPADALERKLDEAERDLARVEAAAASGAKSADDLARFEQWLRDQGEQLPGASPEARQKFLLAGGAEVWLYRPGGAVAGSQQRWHIPTLDAVLEDGPGASAGVSSSRHSHPAPLRISLLPLPPPDGLAAD